MRFAKKKIQSSRQAQEAKSCVQHCLSLAKVGGKPVADGNHVKLNWWGVTLVTWLFDEGAAVIVGRQERIPCETAEEAVKLFIYQMEVGKN